MRCGRAAKVPLLGSRFRSLNTHFLGSRLLFLRGSNEPIQRAPGAPAMASSVATHSAPASRKSAQASALTEPSDGHMPRGRRPKYFSPASMARRTWTAASSRKLGASGSGRSGMPSRALEKSHSRGTMGW